MILSEKVQFIVQNLAERMFISNSKLKHLGEMSHLM